VRERRRRPDHKHVLHYTSNDKVRQAFSIVLTARRTGGAPTPSDEASEAHWVAPTDRSMRPRINHYLELQALSLFLSAPRAQKVRLLCR
jgi:hypothetical protein